MKIKAIALLITGSMILSSCGNNQDDNKIEKNNNSTEIVSKEKNSNENPKID